MLWRRLFSLASSLPRSSLAPRAAERGFASKLTLFVKRAGAQDFAEVTADSAASVAALKEAVAAKLRVDAPLDAVLLSRAAGGGPLDARLSLDAAGLAARDEIVLSVAKFSPPLSTFSGVLHRAPARLDGDALAAFAAASTPPRARLAALGALVAELGALDARALGPGGLPLPLLRTEAHLALVEALAWQARGLAAGAFVGVNGLPCRTLVGARGIGKTAVLRAFCAVAPSAFPSLAVLYATGEGVADARSAFRAAHLLELIEAAVAERALAGAGAGAGSGVSAGAGAGAGPAQRGRGGDVDALLDAAGMRAFVVLDEVDELYRVPDTEAASVANVNATLGTLATLGGSTAGRFSVILCGSSAATPRLVCGDGEHLAGRFPLVRHGIPNLTSHKFRPLRIPSAPCSAAHEVADMLALLARRAALPRSALPAARLVAFFVGSSPRAVAAAVSAASVELGAARPSARSRTAAAARGLAAALVSGALPVGPVGHDAEVLYGALLARLVTANAGLRSLIGGASGAAAQIAALLDDARPWEAAVVPLTLRDAASAWEGVAARSPASAALARDSAYLAGLLDELADGYRLHVVRDAAGAGGGAVWPVTAAQIVFASGSSVSVGAMVEAAAAALAPAARLIAVAQTAAAAARTVGL